MPDTAIDLLLSDVDGTLVTRDKVLTMAAVAAVQRLRAAGIAFTLASARPPRGLRMFVEPLDLRLPLAGFNGGLIVDHDFTVIESHPIDPQIARQAVRLIEDCGLDLWVYGEHDWVVSAADGPHVAREATAIAMHPAARALTDADLAGAYKIVGVSCDRARVTGAQQRAAAQFGTAVSISSSEAPFVDITHPLANKGAVVHSLARWLDLPPARIASIGDMANDVPMFAQSGRSIAMGNAGADVQAKADFLTDSNEANGFAHAIDRFILRNPEDA